MRSWSARQKVGRRIARMAVVQADVLFPERLRVPVLATVELGVDGAPVAGAHVNGAGGPVGAAGPYASW
ncbi:hypothetical protein [Streptomyces sp. NPDC092370]|uniref:hypothetical protein n=1 Tax=Streptomyces sp. NPDC092370 TaxID=3366016 RepID=UPI0038032220